MSTLLQIDKTYTYKNKDMIKGIYMLIRVLTVIFVSVVCVSCSQDEPEIDLSDWDLYGPAPTDDILNNPGMWNYYHNLYILFEDEDGNNLTASIKQEYTAANKEMRYSIPKDSFRLTFDDELNIRWNDPIQIPLLDDNNYYVDLSLRLHLYEVTKVMTRKLYCPALFGDEEEHIIITDYQTLPKIKSLTVPMQVMRFTLDGKEYPVRDNDRVTVTIPAKKN